MIRAFIVDDEPLATSLVEELLSKHEDVQVDGIYHDGFSALKAIQNQPPDLLFLDVQMPKISGLELLELLDEIPPVIFTTAFDQYAVQAFETHAIDYLLKPFNQQRFDEALNRFKKRNSVPTNLNAVVHNQPITRIVLKDSGSIKIIALKKLAYLKADDDYVELHSEGKKYIKKTTLKQYESSLPKEQFVRIHRSYMVNVQYITAIEPYEKTTHLVILTTGEQLPVSRSGYQRLKEALKV